MQYQLIRAALALVAALALAPQAQASRLTPSTRLSAQALGSGAHTASVSVPTPGAGTATAEIAFYFGYVSSNQAPTSVSIGGQTAVKKVSQEAGSSMQIAVYAASGVPSGTQTLAWTNPVAYSALDFGVEYRDGTITYGATDTDFCSGCGTLGTNPIANTSGDEILCAYGANGGTLSSFGGGQTDLDGTSGTSYYGFQSKTGSGGTATLSFTFSAGNDAYACVALTTTVFTGTANPLSGPIDGHALTGPL